jgi:hypothetical protein
MANIPQKSKDASNDPTEQAISAIEDALNVRDFDRRAEPEYRPDAAAADLFHEPEQPTLWGPETAAPRQPANDDRANMGLILQTLRRRRARGPYIVATVTALAWVAGAAAIAFLSGAELQTLIATPRVGLAVTAALAAGIVVPVVFF